MSAPTTAPQSEAHPDPARGNGAAHAAGHAAPHATDEHEIPTDLPRPGTGTVVIATIVFVLLLAALFVIGYIPHERRAAEARDDAKEAASGLPVVTVEAPKKAAGSKDLVLPCDVRANQDTDIYPRANGYLKKWYADIQDRVEAGQLLAEIDTPEVDAQLQQSKAQLEQSKANVLRSEADLALAQKNLDRFIEANKTSPGSVTEQQVDQNRAAYDDAKAALEQTKASVASSEADVQRLTVLQGFEKVTAPFAGIITARNYDVGALLNPTATGPGKQIYSIAQTDTLRVFVNVPQSYATQVKVGQPVFLKVRNYPDREFTGTIARTTGSLDATTRTLAVELHFPNKDNALYAGMYGQVRLPVTNEQPVLVIKSSSLLFNAAGTQVATVKDGNKIHLQKVDIARDLGTELEIASGLTPDDKVVTNPGEKLGEGVAVDVTEMHDGTPGAPDQQQKRTRVAGAAN